MWQLKNDHHTLHARFRVTGLSLIQILIVACLGLPSSSSAQSRNVMIDNTGNSQETSIVINPANPLHILAGANLNKYYYSTNGGTSWTTGFLSSKYGVVGDPCVIV